MNLSNAFAAAKILFAKVALAFSLVDHNVGDRAANEAKVVALADGLIEAIPGTSPVESLAKAMAEGAMPFLVDWTFGEAEKLGVLPTSAT